MAQTISEKTRKLFARIADAYPGELKFMSSEDYPPPLTKSYVDYIAEDQKFIGSVISQAGKTLLQISSQGTAMLNIMEPSIFGPHALVFETTDGSDELKKHLARELQRSGIAPLQGLGRQFDAELNGAPEPPHLSEKGRAALVQLRVRSDLSVSSAAAAHNG